MAFPLWESYYTNCCFTTFARCAEGSNWGVRLQARSLPQTNSVMQQNWVHDSPKYGLRFDGEPPKTGRNGTMLRNVVWRCNGMMVKGFDHKVFNNLVFHKYNERGDNDKQGFKCTLCVLRYVRSNPGPINDGTVTIRNVADKANGGYHNDVLYPIAGYAQDNVLEDAKTEVVDAYNMDFRPRAGSRVVAKNAGPYDFNQKKYYWIPGRHEYKASTPVPPDGSTVKPGRDAVMWLNGFGATAHAVYFGTEREAVDKANKSSPEYRYAQCRLQYLGPRSEISPATSPEILHHTVWRTWLFIAYSDERWSRYQFSLPHLHVSL